MAGFHEIIGHQQIIEHLKNAIGSDQVSHAYIFNGPKGSGKRILAEAFAMTLQCELKLTDPCMSCHSCRQFLSGNQPDILYLYHEKPNTISVDDIRRQINRDIGIKPYQGPYKVYIVPEAEKMNEQAQNALLKTIEEPPPYAIILLLTTNADAFLPTINSRCIRLNLKPVANEEIKAFLMEQRHIPDYQASLAVAFAQGQVGKAIQLAENENFNLLKESVLQLVRRLKDIELYELSGAIKQIEAYKLEINDYLDLLLVWFRDVLLYKATADVDSLIFKEEISEVQRWANESSYPGIENIIHALEKSKLRLKANVNFELVMELLLLTIKEN